MGAGQQADSTATSPVPAMYWAGGESRTVRTHTCAPLTPLISHNPENLKSNTNQCLKINIDFSH